MKKAPSNRPAGLSRRVSFPDDERRLPWLGPLLDCYAIADTGVAIAVRDAEKKQKKALACGPSCDVCCHQPDIPLYPHELPALQWYVSEKVAPETREIVLRQLNAHAKGSACPFLVDHVCAVHAVRPIACRQYNVFTTPCAPGEDPYYSRRQDVLVPAPEYTDRAFTAIAVFYGTAAGKDRDAAVQSIRARISNLQEQDWQALITALVGNAGASGFDPEQKT